MVLALYKNMTLVANALGLFYLEVNLLDLLAPKKIKPRKQKSFG
jgi:hypothetical protein